MPSVCISCASAPGRYTCPRCHGPYCSSGCYKTHGATCTESFYREQVENHVTLQQKQTADGPVDAEPLVRAALSGQGAAAPDEPPFDDDDGPDSDGGSDTPADPEVAALAAAIHAASLEGRLAEMLPDDIKSAFDRAVARGTVGSSAAGAALAGWTPWWRHDPEEHERHYRHAHTAADTGAQRHGYDEDEPHVTCLWQQPGGVLPTTQELTRPGPRKAGSGPGTTASSSPTRGTAAAKDAQPSPVRKPSPLLRFNVLDVLLSYVHVQRLHAGRAADRGEAAEAGTALLMLSAVLGNDAKHSSVSAALSAVEQAGTNPWLSLVSSRDGGGGPASLEGGLDMPALLQAQGRLSHQAQAASLAKLSAHAITSIALLSDLCCLLASPHYVVDALLDSRAVTAAAIQDLRAALTDGTTAQTRGQGRETAGHDAARAELLRLQAAERKCLFLACWAHEVLVVPEDHMSPFDRVAAGLQGGAEICDEMRQSVSQYIMERLALANEADRLWPAAGAGQGPGPAVPAREADGQHRLELQRSVLSAQAQNRSAGRLIQELS